MPDPDYNPYDPEGYDSPSLPYIPYGLGEPHAPDSPTPDGNDATIYDITASASPAYPGFAPVPGQMLPQPGEDIASLAGPTGGKRRRSPWLIPLIVVACLLVIAAGIYGAVVYSNRPTPMKTLDVFCKDLQNGQYQQAYDQFSPNLQAQFTEADFAQLLSQDKVDSCTHGTASDSGSTATTSLKLVHHSKGVNNDVVTLRKDSHNNWKIDDLEKA